MSAEVETALVFAAADGPVWVWTSSRIDSPSSRFGFAPALSFSTRFFLPPNIEPNCRSASATIQIVAPRRTSVGRACTGRVSGSMWHPITPRRDRLDFCFARPLRASRQARSRRLISHPISRGPLLGLVGCGRAGLDQSALVGEHDSLRSIVEVELGED